MTCDTCGDKVPFGLICCDAIVNELDDEDNVGVRIIGPVD